MSTYLVFPLPPVTPGGQAGPHFRIKLQVRRNHPASNYGLGAVLVGREILDGHAFAYLRDCAGAWIESNDLPIVAGALGLSVQDIAPRADKGENMSIHFKNAVSLSELITTTENLVRYVEHRSAIAIAVGETFAEVASLLYKSEREALGVASKIAQRIAAQINKDQGARVQNNRWCPSIYPDFGDLF